jgi:CheY-like chemotaxis protein
MMTASAPQAPVIDRSLLSGVRVLVVDDEADARITLGAILEQFGAEPTIVASARDALDAIAQTHPDFLLSDVAMPTENGYALIRRIRTTLAADRLPAAALSAYVDGDSRSPSSTVLPWERPDSADDRQCSPGFQTDLLALSPAVTS